MTAEIELRHIERDFLFELLKAKEKGDIDEAIAGLTARMEQEDVKLVKQVLAEWKEQSKR